MHDDASTILLVEDDLATRTFLADNLTADGYDLLVADTCAEGARLLETKFPDLAVVDLTLPDGSGYDLIRRVREADGVVSRIDPTTPLVILSGRGGELDRVRGFERGVDDYIAKPFSYGELRGAISSSDRRPLSSTSPVVEPKLSEAIGNASPPTSSKCSQMPIIEPCS